MISYACVGGSLAIMAASAAVQSLIFRTGCYYVTIATMMTAESPIETNEKKEKSNIHTIDRSAQNSKSDSNDFPKFRFILFIFLAYIRVQEFEDVR